MKTKVQGSGKKSKRVCTRSLPTWNTKFPLKQKPGSSIVEDIQKGNVGSKKTNTHFERKMKRQWSHCTETCVRECVCRDV